MNLKSIKLNPSDYERIKDLSLSLNNSVSAQEVLGVFDDHNIFIYEYNNTVRLNNSDIKLLLPIIDKIPDCIKSTVNKISIIVKMFGSDNNVKVNEQSMFFVEKSKILEIN